MKKNETTLSADTFDNLKGATKVAARLARTYGEAYFVLETPYGSHVDTVDCWNSSYKGEVVLAVVPDGTIMVLNNG